MKTVPQVGTCTEMVFAVRLRYTEPRIAAATHPLDFSTSFITPISAAGAGA